MGSHQEGKSLLSYVYAKQKPAVLTDQGQLAFLQVRDFVAKALKIAGAVRAGEAMNAATLMSDSWDMMACVDRLVEIGELREIPTPPNSAWQDRVFVKGR